MALGKMTAMAAALSASGAMAENVTPVAQTTESNDRLQMQLDIIEDARLRASNACNIQFMTDLTALGAVIDNGEVHAENREKVIEILEGLGAPEGNLDNSPNEDLMRLVETMPITNISGCIAKAEGDAIASLKDLRVIMAENVRIFEAETASYEEINILFNGLEELAADNAELLARINVLREATLQLRAQAEVSAAEADEYQRQIEAIWQEIATDV